VSTFIGVPSFDSVDWGCMHFKIDSKFSSANCLFTQLACKLPVGLPSIFSKSLIKSVEDESTCFLIKCVFSSSFKLIFTSVYTLVSSTLNNSVAILTLDTLSILLSVMIKPSLAVKCCFLFDFRSRSAILL
jgi:hypothetical protein